MCLESGKSNLHSEERSQPIGEAEEVPVLDEPELIEQHIQLLDPALGAAARGAEFSQLPRKQVHATLQGLLGSSTHSCSVGTSGSLEERLYSEEYMRPNDVLREPFSYIAPDDVCLGTRKGHGYEHSPEGAVKMDGRSCFVRSIEALGEHYGAAEGL